MNLREGWTDIEQVVGGIEGWGSDISDGGTKV